MGFPASPLPLDDVARVLAVYAHPDDVDFGSCATVARWVAEGLEVSYLIVTRGEAGGPAGVARKDLPAIREAEQRAAAAVVGVERVEFLDGYADGTLLPTIGLRHDIARVIRRVRPDRVLTSSPLRRWEHIAGPSHPDHLAVGEATTCAVYPDARNPFAFPDLLAEGLQPWTVREVWYSAGPDPDHFVDVTETYDRKVAALRAHASQTASQPDIDSRVRRMLTDNGRTAGLADGRLAEGFSVIRTA